MVLQGTILLQDSDTTVNQDSYSVYREAYGLPPLPKGSLIFQKVMNDIRRDSLTIHTEGDNDTSTKTSELSDSKKKRLFHRRVMVKGTHIYVFLSRNQATCEGQNGRWKQTTIDNIKQRRWTTHLGPSESPRKRLTWSVGEACSGTSSFPRRPRLSMGNDVFLPSITTKYGASDSKPRSHSEPLRSREN